MVRGWVHVMAGERSSSVLQRRRLCSRQVLPALGRRHDDHSLAQSEVRRNQVCCQTTLRIGPVISLSLSLISRERCTNDLCILMSSYQER